MNNRIFLKKTEKYRNEGWDQKGLTKEYKEIKEGVRNGLTEKQVDIYAKKCFNHEQMYEIRIGLKEGLGEEKVLMYAKPEFDGEQMWSIKKAFTDGLSVEQVKLFAKPEVQSWKMKELTKAFTKYPQLNGEQVEVLINQDFYGSGMTEITKGFMENHLSVEQVKIIANPKLDSDQMEQLRIAFTDGLSIEQVKSIANPYTDWEKMMALRLAYYNNHGSEKEIEKKVELYTRPEISKKDLTIIEWGVKAKLSKVQMNGLLNTLLKSSRSKY